MVSVGKGPNCGLKGESWAGSVIGESDTTYFWESCKLVHISEFWGGKKRQLEIQERMEHPGFLLSGLLQLFLWGTGVWRLGACGDGGLIWYPNG